ncbi:hypothetical protein G3580_07390 [Nitrogeniibacter mangrovi]|uniref:Lysozyme inhibitor LprI N-terminal domain-containing protein n=1 Tax=Nitrogeniibacter mangrovi TaxID=2016596 RepID=A0A6C1B1J1_9RHOO|nr:hypothetical protein [Nitrogeniibacter mangrovi]QID17482.1 hypothetical protein G3580_07390 [Nitrogeniibacter mangrovi]
MKRIVPALLALVMVRGVVAGGGLSSEDVTWVNRFADRMAAQCASRFDEATARLREKTGPAGERARALMAIERHVNCECLPTRVRVRATPAVVAALRTQDVAVARAFMREQAQACGALGLRESAYANCLSGEQENAFRQTHGRLPDADELDAVAPPDAAMAATCRCYSDEVQALDDATLVAEAEASYRNDQARIADPSVPRYEGRVGAILQACRRRAGAD